MLCVLGVLTRERPAGTAPHTYDVKPNAVVVFRETFHYWIKESTRCSIAMNEYHQWLLCVLALFLKTDLDGMYSATFVYLDLTDPDLLIAQARET